MVENEQDSDTKVLEDFELSSELSALVDNNVIPKKIANKLEEKLKERKVKITKSQLNMLAEKIRTIFKEYMKNQKDSQKDKSTGQSNKKETDKNTKDMNEKIILPKEPEEKYPSYQANKNIASGTLKDSENYGSSRVVTTEDIKIPGQQKQYFGDLKLDPLLEIPRDTESIIILMKWLQNLIDKCGRQNLSNILDYYVEIGWIIEDVKISLIDYSHGITEEEKIGKLEKKVSDLPSKDHIESLLFIQKIKGKQFDKHFIDRIEGEISRMTKKIGSYSS